MVGGSLPFNPFAVALSGVPTVARSASVRTRHHDVLDPAHCRRNLGRRPERTRGRRLVRHARDAGPGWPDPRAANITSTIALFPGQVATGYAGARVATGAERLSLEALVLISLAGGIFGALLLLVTPPTFFAGLVPWLVLFATAVFFWGSFVRKSHEGTLPLGRGAAALAQFLIAIYGGYFGGGIGFLMMAVLTVAGLPVRNAAATKNVLAATMNASAVVIFLFSRDVHWAHAAAVGGGGVCGGLIGAALLTRVNERWLRVGVVILGVALATGTLPPRRLVASQKRRARINPPTLRPMTTPGTCPPVGATSTAAAAEPAAAPAPVRNRTCRAGCSLRRRGGRALSACSRCLDELQHRGELVDGVRHDAFLHVRRNHDERNARTEPELIRRRAAARDRRTRRNHPTSARSPWSASRARA